jgi:hypothetical protein
VIPSYLFTTWRSSQFMYLQDYCKYHVLFFGLFVLIFFFIWYGKSIYCMKQNLSLIEANWNSTNHERDGVESELTFLFLPELGNNSH